MSERPYKKAKTSEQALSLLLPNYDEELLKKAIEIRMKFSEN
jgi:HD-GYP domain-containing protein (c-di-GMP phosphodiesterase class II)